MNKHFQVTIDGDFRKSGKRFHTFLVAKSFQIKGSVAIKENQLVIEAEGDEVNLQKFIMWCKHFHLDAETVAFSADEKPLSYYDDFLIL